MNPFKVIANFFQRIFAPMPKQPVSPIAKVNTPPKLVPAVEDLPTPEIVIEKVPFDLVKFISSVEGSFGEVKATQLDGFIYILRKWHESKLTDLRWLAYMLATTWHETGRKMQPITEYGGALYLRTKKYYPYIGRGYVQLTWRDNYAKYGIADDMNKALDPEFAAHIMIDGMTKGIFTGKKLGDYFSAKTDDPLNARRIINGTDKAQMIAGYHYKFLDALKAPQVKQELKPEVLA